MKKLLFITHQLTLSGAPLVLMDMIRVCREEGYDISVISLTDGPLSKELDRMNIPWRVQNDFLAGWKDFYVEVYNYHAVIVNTLVSYQPIIILNHTRVRTLWWIHESEDYFETYDKMGEAVPNLQTLNANIRILSVSPSVRDIFLNRYGIKTVVQPFCVPDLAPATSDPHDKIRFLTLAMFSPHKGQDLLAQAILLLPDEVRSQCEFYMYGGATVLDPGFQNQIRENLSDIPEAFIHNPISHEEALTALANSDFCIVPSRTEPFSMVAVEAMMLEKPSILTDICGVTWYLKDRENAYFTPSENATALCETIREAVQDYRNRPNLYQAMGASARAVYEHHFTPEQFRQAVRDLLCEYP